MVARVCRLADHAHRLYEPGPHRAGPDCAPSPRVRWCLFVEDSAHVIAVHGSLGMRDVVDCGVGSVAPAWRIAFLGGFGDGHAAVAERGSLGPRKEIRHGRALGHTSASVTRSSSALRLMRSASLRSLAAVSRFLAWALFLRLLRRLRAT
jgi:hypothetical protein